MICFSLGGVLILFSAGVTDRTFKPKWEARAMFRTVAGDARKRKRRGERSSKALRSRVLKKIGIEIQYLCMRPYLLQVEVYFPCRSSIV